MYLILLQIFGPAPKLLMKGSETVDWPEPVRRDALISTRFFSPTFAMVMAMLSGAAASAPVVYFGENAAANSSVSGSPVVARNAFLAGLAANVRNEGFESIASGTLAPLALTFTGSSGNLSATMTGNGQIFDSAGGGRFNTTPNGKTLWEVPRPNQSNFAFEIDFGLTPISAFGFYATDVGDFNGQLTIALTDVNDVVTTRTVQNSTGLDGASAALLFWGIIDAGNSYKKVVFGNTNAGIDTFGFDDMVIGDLGQIRPPNGVPEPVSLALVGTALFGLAATRRRRPPS